MDRGLTADKVKKGGRFQRFRLSIAMEYEAFA
jgi:hypothetical protein